MTKGEEIVARMMANRNVDAVGLIDAAVAEALATRLSADDVVAAINVAKAAAREQAQGEERERCAKVASEVPTEELREIGRGELRRFSGKRVRDDIVAAIRRPPGGAPPICAGGIEPTDTWRPTRPGGAPDEGATG